MQQIGMVGLGLMGRGIAHKLVKHAYPVRLLEHPGNQRLDTRCPNVGPDPVVTCCCGL
jgi:3-hydroxyacyl-CoA dehydrogenase